jgi:hypothetical protein
MKLPLRIETPKPQPITIPAPASPAEQEFAALYPRWSEKPKKGQTK